MLWIKKRTENKDQEKASGSQISNVEEPSQTDEERSIDSHKKWRWRPSISKGGKRPQESEEQYVRRRRKRFMWMLFGITAVLFSVLIIVLGVHFGKKRQSAPAFHLTPGPTNDSFIAGPAVASNFADPCYIKVNGIYYSFATNKFKIPHAGQVNIQMAVSSDFETWNLTNTDALPDVGDWSTGHYVWAPDVVQLDDGTFVMYYSAKSNAPSGHHCVGSATSKAVGGPYTPSSQPFVCPLSQGGAIDPEGFKDVDGKRYVIYKVDGNSMNSPKRGRHPTPLMLQSVDPKDGVTLIGNATVLLNRDDTDGPLIEAPSLGRYAGQNGDPPVYILFYSSNVFTTKYYDVRYATSVDGIMGPYAKATTPLLSSGDDSGGLFGPGGMDVGLDGTKVVFHSGIGGSAAERALWTGQIVVNGTTVSI